MKLFDILTSFLLVINSQALKNFVINKTDICVLSETKINYSFSNSQFFPEGYVCVDIYVFFVLAWRTVAYIIKANLL